MSLDRTDVEKIAHLARIALSEDDIPATTAKLSGSSADGSARVPRRAHRPAARSLPRRFCKPALLPCCS